MHHLIMLLLSAAAFCCFALAMERHQEDLFGRPLALASTISLRVCGWVLLACSLGAAVSQPQWSIAVVAWFGYLTASAGAVFIALIAISRRAA